MEWINVKDRLPEEYMWVLVLAMMDREADPYPISFAMIIEEGEWRFLYTGWNNAVIHGDITRDILQSDITHWMPLPDPPNKTP